MFGATVEVRQQRAKRRGWRVAGVMAVALLAVAPLLSLASQEPHAPKAAHAQALPFAIGERLNYSVHAGIAGTVGHGTMWVEGPVDLRGTATYVLHSDFRANLGLFRPFDHSSSWIDPETLATLRFEKSERHFFSTDSQRVDVVADLQRLDELSFIYYVRTLALGADSAYTVSRHYDAARNPVQVRVIGHDTVKTGAGTFGTVVIEMRVKDSRHFQREGIIKLYLTDDRFHVPVRIESPASVFGSAVFLLDSFSRGGAGQTLVLPN